MDRLTDWLTDWLIEYSYFWIHLAHAEVVAAMYWKCMGHVKWYKLKIVWLNGLKIGYYRHVWIFLRDVHNLAYLTTYCTKNEHNSLITCWVMAFSIKCLMNRQRDRWDLKQKLLVCLYWLRWLINCHPCLLGYYSTRSVGPKSRLLFLLISVCPSFHQCVRPK